MKRCLIVAMLLAGIGDVRAQAVVGSQGLGLGMQSCTEFDNEYKAHPEIVQAAYIAWAEGFMSGLNASATANKLPVRDLSKIDLQSTAADIREYCAMHPFAAYDTAVLTMYNDLPPVFSTSK